MYRCTLVTTVCSTITASKASIGSGLASMLIALAHTCLVIQMSTFVAQTVWLAVQMLTWTPMCMRAFCKFMSRQAILAFTTRFAMPCDALPMFRAYPFSSVLSLALLPCAFKTLIALIGYLAFSPSATTYCILTIDGQHTATRDSASCTMHQDTLQWRPTEVPAKDVPEDLAKGHMKCITLIAKMFRSFSWQICPCSTVESILLEGVKEGGCVADRRLPLGSVLTDVTASTTSCEKKSLSAPTIFEDMAVFAQLMSASFPRFSTLIDKFSSMNLHACSRIRLTLCKAVILLSITLSREYNPHINNPPVPSYV